MSTDDQVTLHDQYTMAAITGLLARPYDPHRPHAYGGRELVATARGIATLALKMREEAATKLKEKEQ